MQEIPSEQAYRTACHCRSRNATALALRPPLRERRKYALRRINNLIPGITEILTLFTAFRHICVNSSVYYEAAAVVVSRASVAIIRGMSEATVCAEPDL